MKAETEAGFTRAVVELARAYGWLCWHPLPLRTGKGEWRTGTQGDVGYPDITAVRGGVMVVAELKSATGRVRPEQEAWLSRLAGVPGVVARTWRPKDWPAIEATFRGEVLPAAGEG